MSQTNPGTGASPPPKPWERAGSPSGSAPFKPPSSGSTSNVVEASGTSNPGEVVPATNQNASTTANILGRPVPARPWEQNYGSTYGSYNSMSYTPSLYNSNSGYGSYGGLYGSGLYNRFGGGMYGGYGGGLYNNGFGGPMGGYGMGMVGPYGNQDPNNPHGPPSPPSFWMSLLRVLHGVVDFFGRFAMLIDQNTQAFHMFMSALLQLCDRSGLLYGELARFVLRILGIRARSRKPDLGPNHPGQRHIEGPKDASGSWDSVWGASGQGTNS